MIDQSTAQSLVDQYIRSLPALDSEFAWVPTSTVEISDVWLFAYKSHRMFGWSKPSDSNPAVIQLALDNATGAIHTIDGFAWYRIVKCQSYRYSSVMDLEIEAPLSSIIMACETECVAECCGFDAFDINPKWLRRWNKEHNETERLTALHQIEQLTDYLTVHKGFFMSTLMNDGTSHSEWIVKLRDLHHAIEQSSLPQQDLEYEEEATIIPPKRS